jgi:hypothetical protein
LADKAKELEIKYGKNIGETKTWDNETDAYRHFNWNTLMTSNLGEYKSRWLANNHEILELKRTELLISIDKDNEIVTTKLNQSTLMDLWNNQVGRALRNNKNFVNYSDYELFKYAKSKRMVITDALKAYEFYGI